MAISQVIKKVDTQTQRQLWWPQEMLCEENSKVYEAPDFAHAATYALCER